ncbi:Uma2 family endonuclease [Actinomadura flavalba]|uniref:Uma2 family endonuclease n=1 Tax=Actinomadura flavalba TaxID=1120938 RepID=UPI000368D06F|nr:Uma2 family endonuclease [Actinomadura flavalba]
MTTTVEWSMPQELTDTPWALWTDGTLGDSLQVPEGSRVEVIGGKVVVSPPPLPTHGFIVHEVSKAFVRAQSREFRWEALQNSNVALSERANGFVPDLVIVDHEVYQATNDPAARHYLPDEIEMVVEVTSYGNARNDRCPPRDKPRTKWNAYAATEIPFYLLVDRDPKISRTFLFTIPDGATAAYLHEESWPFGETISLPEPFNIEIETESWRTW